MKRIWNTQESNHFWITVVSFLFIVGIIVGTYFIGHKQGYNRGLVDGKLDYQTPVEKVVIDTLYIRRDSIINRVKYLEVIKHDTIEKVYVLGNDASIDLFYELVSE